MDMLVNFQYSNNSISPLLKDCRYLVSQISQVRIKHYYCEANRCADKLARKGVDQSLNLVIHENPPVDLFDFVEANLNGVSLARQCLGNLVFP